MLKFFQETTQTTLFEWNHLHIMIPYGGHIQRHRRYVDTRYVNASVVVTSNLNTPLLFTATMHDGWRQLLWRISFPTWLQNSSGLPRCVRTDTADREPPCILLTVQYFNGVSASMLSPMTKIWWKYTNNLLPPAFWNIIGTFYGDHDTHCGRKSLATRTTIFLFYDYLQKVLRKWSWYRELTNGYLAMH